MLAAQAVKAPAPTPAAAPVTAIESRDAHRVKEELSRLMVQADHLREENERLREALRKIAKSQLSDSEQAYIFKMLARAALGEEE